MQQKMELEKQKNEMDMHKNVINSILQGVRASQGSVAAEPNGNGQEF